VFALYPELEQNVKGDAMSSEWVRDNKRRLLFQKRTINGRTRVYGKPEQGSGGHYGYEGYVDPDEKFIRRPDGERIGRGNHPDLIHAEAQKRYQAQAAPKFTDSHGVHPRVNKPVPVNTPVAVNSEDVAEGITVVAQIVGFLIVGSLKGLSPFGTLINLMFLILGIVGLFIPSGAAILTAIVGILFVRFYESNKAKC
jgi:hypothetical protein